MAVKQTKQTLTADMLGANYIEEIRCVQNARDSKFKEVFPTTEAFLKHCIALSDQLHNITVVGLNALDGQELFRVVNGNVLAL